MFCGVWVGMSIHTQARASIPFIPYYLVRPVEAPVPRGVKQRGEVAVGRGQGPADDGVLCVCACVGYFRRGLSGFDIYRAK